VYEVGPRTLLPACPRCGKSPAPALASWRHNGLAAVTAVLAAAALAVGFATPFLTMTTLGERRQFSLVGGIGELFDRGNWVIGSVLFLFSVVFPVAKLLALLAATSRLAPLSIVTRRRLHRAAELTGKYSLLDVVVVAVLVVLVKFRGLAQTQVEAEAGTIWFCGAILLSLLAGLLVKLPLAPGLPGEGVPAAEPPDVAEFTPGKPGAKGHP